MDDSDCEIWCVLKNFLNSLSPLQRDALRQRAECADPNDPLENLAQTLVANMVGFDWEGAVTVFHA